MKKNNHKLPPYRVIQIVTGLRPVEKTEGRSIIYVVRFKNNPNVSHLTDGILGHGYVRINTSHADDIHTAHFTHVVNRKWCIDLCWQKSGRKAEYVSGFIR